MAHPAPPAVVPPAPPEAPGAPGAPEAPPPTMVASYRELLNDESNSPTRDRLENYMRGYRFEGGGIPAPATLRDQTIVLSDRQPMTFLCLIQGATGNPEVSVLHRLMRYMDMPGEDESGYHDTVLGLVGDIMPHQYPTVEVPGTVFHLIGNPVRVLTTAAMVANLPAWDNPVTPLGPYVKADPETEVVRPRNVQLIPGYYAALLLNRRGVTAKMAFQEIHGAMLARDEVDLCGDVLTWLKAAATSRGGGGLQNVVPGVYHPIAPVHLPVDVYSYMIGKVRSDLPALAGAADPLAADARGALAGALRALAGKAGGPADDRGSREPKTVSEAYKETYRTLLRFNNVNEVAELAPLWGRLANCIKGEQHTIMMQEFQRVCLTRGLSAELYTPIVTSALKQMINGFQFVGHGVDDLSTGCQPYTVVYSGSAHHQQVLANASISQQLAQGEQNASLADYRTLRDREKMKFPRDTMDVCITLNRFAVLCQALFQGTGPENPLVVVLWRLVTAMQNGAPFITERYQQMVRTPAMTSTYFAIILRAVQVQVHEYLHAVATNNAESHVGVELPEFRSLVTDLKRGTFPQLANWVPLPAEYLEVPTRQLAGSTAGPARAPSVAPTGTGTAATVSTSVSSLTDPSRAPVQRLANPTPDAEFTNIVVRPGGTRPILREHRPPQNDAGHEFCVAWWLRAGCFPNCGRNATHGPFASPGERTRLLTYCREHLAAPAAGSNT
jgi:hypothetical protein